MSSTKLLWYLSQIFEILLKYIISSDCPKILKSALMTGKKKNDKTDMFKKTQP